MMRGDGKVKIKGLNERVEGANGWEVLWLHLFAVPYFLDVCGSVRTTEHLYLQWTGRGPEPTAWDCSHKPEEHVITLNKMWRRGQPILQALERTTRVSSHYIMWNHVMPDATLWDIWLGGGGSIWSDPISIVSPNHFPRIKVVLQLALKEEKQSSDLSCWPISMV